MMSYSLYCNYISYKDFWLHKVSHGARKEGNILSILNDDFNEIFKRL